MSDSRERRPRTMYACHRVLPNSRLELVWDQGLLQLEGVDFGSFYREFFENTHHELRHPVPEWGFTYRILAFFVNDTELLTLAYQMQPLESSMDILASLNDIVLELDDQFVFTSVAASDEQPLFFPKDQILGRSIEDVLPLDVTLQFVERLNRAFETKQKVCMTYPSPYVPDRWYEATIRYLLAGRYVVAINDVSEKKALEVALTSYREALKQQVDLQECLFAISTGLVDVLPEELDSVINRSLEKLGGIVGADRVYSFSYDFSRGLCSNTYEWCAAGIEPEIANLQDVPLEMIEEWVSCHKQGDAFYVPDVGALENGALRDILEPQGIKSLLALPMMSESECHGFVGFDSVRDFRTYTESEQRLLTGFGHLLLNALKRRAVEEALGESKVWHERITENIPVGLFQSTWSKEEGLRFLYCSKKTAELLSVSPEDLCAHASLFFDGMKEEHWMHLCRRFEESAEDLSLIAQEVLFYRGMTDVWLSLRATPRRVPEGFLIWDGILADIDEGKRQAQALEREKNRLHTIIEGTNLGTWELNLQTRQMVVSDTWARAIGYELGELTPFTLDSWIGLFHPSDAQRVLASLEGHRKRKLAYYDVEARLRHKEGHYVWLHSKGTIVSFTDEGLPLWIFGTSVDTTDRKKIQEILSERDALLEGLSKNLPGAIFQYRLAPCGATSFPYASAGIWDVYEVTPKEIKEDATAILERIHPEDTERVMNSVSQSAKDLSDWDEEFRVLLPEKGLAWVRATSRPERLPDGTILWYGYSTDITELKAIEVALRSSDQRLRNLVSSVPGAIFQCRNDEFWTMDFISRAIEEITGYEMAGFVGNGARSYASIIYKDDVGRVREVVDSAVARGKEYSLDYRLVDYQGSIRWVSEHGQGVYDTAGNLLFINGIITDITKYKALENKVSFLAAALDSCESAVLARDLEGGIEMMNKTYGELLGVSSLHALTEKPETMLPSFLKEELAETLDEKDTHALSLGEYLLREERTDRGSVLRKTYPVFSLEGVRLGTGSQFWEQKNEEEGQDVLKKQAKDVSSVSFSRETTCSIGDYSVLGVTLPKTSAKGDTYSLLQRGNRLVFYSLEVLHGDCTKELPLLFCQGLLESYLQCTPERELSPRDVLSFLARQEEHTSLGTVELAVFVLVFDIEKNKAVFSSAGLKSPPFLRDKEGAFEFLIGDEAPLSLQGSERSFSEKEMVFPEEGVLFLASQTIHRQLNDIGKSVSSFLSDPELMGKSLLDEMMKGIVPLCEGVDTGHVLVFSRRA